MRGRQAGAALSQALEFPILDLIGIDFAGRPWLESIIAIALLLMAALVGNWIAKRVVLQLFRRILRQTPIAEEADGLTNIARRLSNLVPAIIVGAGIDLVPHVPGEVIAVVTNLAEAFMVLTIARALGATFDFAEDLYQRRPKAGMRPIKGFVQVGKIGIYFIAVILMVAAIIDESPLILFSGLGALAAILLLVFKDTILSLVASVQLSTNDMIRVGDWITMENYGADGDVVDIALHTVKVQNFDKTITTIPTHALISDSFRNWRGMQESGGRRIKRQLMIDQNSIRFLTGDEIADARRFTLLIPYIDRKEEEIADWNESRLGPKEQPVNARRQTNIGLMRAYIEAYLRSDRRISDIHSLMVRQLASGADGLPLEIYCFTDTTDWATYEGIQADIFDHLIAILPEFGLRLFQKPSGLDLAGAMRGSSKEAVTV
ncbi:mechanosensitive ion channel family protein [Pacificimonas flava]|uniref:Mechanosensing system component YbdG n=1 Tax=Pacificimonas flava TaxID=1234595 RepID=M2SBS3_9SPHN|nr:mechanosensitive ion channel domain-containing protein [Pacificimonas flava]EMD82815.1 Small-conductance mechanosensitive channel [Pacificimonas flava]MBB5279431.1 miniconductance mechanosensitive channel [Pacificimonas flava]